MNTGSEAQFNLSAWALKNQQMVSFFMLLVIAMGVFCYEKLPRNEDPAFTIKTAVVSAQWPGASVTDTTRLLTDTLEKKLQETPWLDYLESETRAGRTVIHVNLRDDTPPQRVPDIWYQVRKKMQDIAPSLPEGVQGPAVDDEFDDTFGTIYAFIPEGFTLREVRDRAETIRSSGFSPFLRRAWPVWGWIFRTLPTPSGRKTPLSRQERCVPGRRTWR